MRLPENGAGTAAALAADKLTTTLGVTASFPVTYVTSDGLSYRKPRDGTGWDTWQLDPERTAGTQQKNWQQQSLNLPSAWGCNAGSASTVVEVIDSRMHALTEPTNVTNTFNPDQLAPAVANVLTWHGDAVTKILASPGDDNVGMSGVMWRAAVRQVDVSAYDPTTHLPKLSSAGTTLMATNYVEDAIAFAPEDRARVINISLGSGIDATKPTTAADSVAAANLARTVLRGLSRADSTVQASGGSLYMPLVVISAGNVGGDAKWSGYPQAAADPTYGKYVVVVTSSVQHAGHTPTTLPSYAGTGSLVTVAAPGDDVWVTGPNGTPVQISGTSFATPAVAGIAGLLFDFDSLLTPERAKQLIVNGAAAGGRTAKDGTGRTYPVADAHASLKLAAQRPGAPLCGNRIWMDNLTLYVARDTTAQPSGEALGSVDWSDWGRSPLSTGAAASGPACTRPRATSC